MRDAAVLALHLPEAIQTDGDDGDAEILRQDAAAGLECGHLACFGVVDFAFGEDEDAVAAVDGFAGVEETFAKAGKSWEREDVEERDDEPVAELIYPALGEEPVAWWTAHALERLAAHGGSEAMTKARRQGGEDEADVSAARDVIGNDENGAADILKIFAAEDFGVAENLRGRPDERVVDREAEPADGLALGPARVGVFRAASGGLMEQVLDVSDGSCFGEGGFVEFELIALLQGAHELHAIEGAEVEIALKIMRLVSHREIRQQVGYTGA